MPPRTCCQQSLRIISYKPNAFPLLQESKNGSKKGTLNWLGLVKPQIICREVGRRDVCTSLSLYDGKCSMDLIFIDFSIIKEGCLYSEQPPKSPPPHHIPLVFHPVHKETLSKVLTYHNANRALIFYTFYMHNKCTYPLPPMRCPKSQQLLPLAWGIICFFGIINLS